MPETRKTPSGEIKSGEIKKEKEPQKLPEEIEEAIKSGDFNFEMLKGSDIKLDSKIAQKLIEQGKGWDVICNTESFTESDHNKIAQLLIDSGSTENIAGLANNLRFLKGLDSDTAQKLIEKKEARAVADNLENFQGLDHEELAYQLIDLGWGPEVVQNLEKFHNLDDNKIAKQLIDSGRSSSINTLSDNLKKFKDLYSRIAQQLIEAKKGLYVVQNLEIFRGINYQDMAEDLIKRRQGRVVAKFLEKFRGVDNKKIIDDLIKFGDIGTIARNIKKFQGIDHNKIAEKLIENNDIWTLVENIKDFQGLEKSIAKILIDDKSEADSVARYIDNFKDLDQEIAIKLIESGSGMVVINNLEKFPGSNHDEILKKLIEQGYSDILSDYLEEFKNLSEETVRVLFGELLKRNNTPAAVKVNSYFGEFDKVLTRSYQDFGDHLTSGVYQTYQQLENGEISKEAEILGVKHFGETGINELKNKLRGLQSELLSGELDPQLALDSEIARRFLMKTVRYEESQWGGHTEEEFIRIVKNFQRLPEEYKGLPEEYVPSEVLSIAKVDKEKQAEFEFSEQFLSRYGTLMRSIKEARMLADNPDAVTELQDITKQKKEMLLAKLQERLAAIDNPKARENLELRINDLQSRDLDKLTNPQETFKVLSSFKGEFDEELREFMFYWAFQFHPNLQNENLAEFDPNDPTLEQLSWSLNFIDHIVNQETFKKYFTDKKARKAFEGLLNTAALQQELARWQNQDTKGSMSMQFIPSRDLLTEFSGHIGDACWASKYDSILEEYPNFVSLTMVQNPGDPKNERLAGSCMLIDTKTELEAEPLLIIRGLNPQENVINQLDIEDFYKKLVDYLKPIAEAKPGRKLAIVIDDHSGGSSSNRPNLFRFLENIKGDLIRVRPANEDTEFNWYDITRDTYLVE